MIIAMRILVVSICAFGMLYIESNTENIVENYTLSIQFSNLRLEGTSYLELLDKNEKTIKEVKQLVIGKDFKISINGINTGQYAIQYFHDENNNGKMDTNMFGVPKEGYGFSNNARGFMSAPKFENQLFFIENDTTIILKTKY